MLLLHLPLQCYLLPVTAAAHYTIFSVKDLILQIYVYSQIIHAKALVLRSSQILLVILQLGGTLLITAQISL